MEAKDIPVGSVVTKKTGEKLYLLRDDIKIFGALTPDQKEMLREIKADAGTRFMVADNGDVNIVHGGQELMWHADPEDLKRWMYNRESHQ